MGREDWLGSEVLSRHRSSRHERILNSSSVPAPLRTLGSGRALAKLPLINLARSVMRHLSGAA